MKAAFVEHAPNMVFLLLPAFALLLRVLYRRAPVFYAEHFVFALHNHAFAFLALTVAHVASVWLRPVGLGPMAAVPLLWMPVYFFVSMRRVYGGSRLRTPRSSSCSRRPTSPCCSPRRRDGSSRVMLA